MTGSNFFGDTTSKELRGVLSASKPCLASVATPQEVWLSQLTAHEFLVWAESAILAGEIMVIMFTPALLLRISICQVIYKFI